MDINRIIARAKALLISPRTEWPVIAGEATTLKDLYAGYFVWLAAIPAVCGFIRNSIIGYGAAGVHVRLGFFAGLGQMIIGYIVSLVLLYVVALIIVALADTFQAERNRLQAVKAIGYAWTAAWVAGFAMLIPGLGTLLAIVGGVYSIYLLHVGLPYTMKCPPERAAGYTAATVVITIVLAVVLGFITNSMFAPRSVRIGDASTSITIDKNSRLGKLEEMGKRMEQAGKRMEAAQKAGDKDAAANALGTMLGAAAGSDGAIESLPPDQLKALMPDKVNGMKRRSISAQRQTVMGMQTSEVEAVYGGDDAEEVTLKITDTGGAKGLLAMAGAFGMIEKDEETEYGFDRTWREKGRMIHASWDSRSRYGEYDVIIGDRFKVAATGTQGSIDDLKKAAASVDFSKLERLKDHGVK